MVEQTHNKICDFVLFVNFADVLPKAVMNSLTSRDQLSFVDIGREVASTHRQIGKRNLRMKATEQKSTLCDLA